MNYIDLSVLALLGLSLLFGMFGKARNKIGSMIAVLGGIIASYFTFDKLQALLYDRVTINGESIKDFIINLIPEDYSSIATALDPMADTIIGVIVFWLECIVLRIAFGIIISIILGIFKPRKNEDGRRRYMKAGLTLGIPSVIKCAAVLMIILLPLSLFIPVLKSADDIASIANKDGAIEPYMGYITTGTELMDNSMAIDKIDYALSLDGVRFLNCKTDDGKQINVYKQLKDLLGIVGKLDIQSLLGSENIDIKSIAEMLEKLDDNDLTTICNLLDSVKPILLTFIPDDSEDQMMKTIKENLETMSCIELLPLLKLATAIDLEALTGEDANPASIITSLAEMSEEDLGNALAFLDNNKELITEMVPAETFTDLGIDINEICFADEASVIKVAAQAITFDEEGEMSFDLEKVETTDIANALADSELLGSVLEPGMLSDAPADVVAEMTAVFDQKLEGGEIDQAKYDLLMSYFEIQENP